MERVEIQLEKHNYNYDESIKALRTNIEFCGADKKTLCVTSSHPNEGKSTVTLELSKSLADSGKRVLLVDCDMRKSVLKARVRVEKKLFGLSHFLSKQVGINEIICHTNITNFSILFAGAVPPNPAELLSNQRFEAFVNDAKTKFDYVIFDAPPLNNVIDAAIIARQCDGSIIVVESGGTERKEVLNVKQQLAKTNKPILGVILNKVDVKRNGYYGKYGKYSKYGIY